MTRYYMNMRIRFHFGKVALAALASGLLLCSPAVAQTNGHLNHSNLKPSPGQGARAPRPKPLPPRANAGAQQTVNRAQSNPTTTTTTQSCDQPGNYYDNYNGYRVPVYPGPNAPLPPTGGYYNDPYYGYGYYNNGYYNNGYYNNGYQSGGYYNSGNYNNGYQSGGFPPFERY